MGSLKQNFYNANHAFNFLWDYIKDNGVDFDNTKAIFNCGFTMHHPEENTIDVDFRGWNEEYAKAEWQWYLSGDQNIDKLGEIYGKIPPIWQRMADRDGNVNSNYGWQWKRNNQIDYVVGKLRTNPNTRHAAISIYDCKEYPKYNTDTPCTYAVQFTILDNKLNMSVYMRSNDLWYGFCNDQYCFSMLHKIIAERLSMETGWYYHHAHNMHIYNDKLDKR
jgi:thymidylate synthase